MSIVDKPVSENKVELLFRVDKSTDETVKNVFINASIPGIFPTENISTKFNCREHYNKQGFAKVHIRYDHVKGLHIIAFKNTNSTNRQELFVPEKYIMCVGVDYESKQPE